MPSKSEAEHNLMEAADHGEPWAVKKVKPSVAHEFVIADIGRKFGPPKKKEAQK